MIKRTFFLLSTIIAFLITSCYYDNEEELYPQKPECDTTNISFSADVQPILNNYCITCHGGSAPSAGISLTNYDEIVASASNGGLMGTIKHESGWSPMPKNGTKISDCEISKLDAWIAEGTPDN